MKGGEQRQMYSSIKNKVLITAKKSISIVLHLFQDHWPLQIKSPDINQYSFPLLQLYPLDCQTQNQVFPWSLFAPLLKSKNSQFQESSIQITYRLKVLPQYINHIYYHLKCVLKLHVFMFVNYYMFYLFLFSSFQYPYTLLRNSNGHGYLW